MTLLIIITATILPLLRSWIFPPYLGVCEGENCFRRFRKRSVTSIQSNKEESIEPEVFLCGEPRLPPSPYFFSVDECHVWMLRWARNDLVFPRNSRERQDLVFPRDITANSTMRMLSNQLSFESIVDKFSLYMNDVGQSKQFLLANLDLISPAFFTQALVMAKFSARYRNDAGEMVRLNKVFQRYRVALDSLTFPMHVEILKAETRIATYVVRDEINRYINAWDKAEINCYFLTLLAARLKWSSTVQEIDDYIEEKGSNVPTLFRYEEKIRLRKSSLRNKLTSVVYEQALERFQDEFPRVFEHVNPELKFAAESFSLDPVDLKRFAEFKFCPKLGLNLRDLKQRLLLLSNFLDSLTINAEFKKLPQYLIDLYMILANDEEAENYQHWYNPDDFVYTPYFIDDDKDLSTFNALEKLFSDDLAELPQDIMYFRGIASYKNFLNIGSTSSQTEEWVARDNYSSYESDVSSKEDSLDIATLFLKELEQGRKENPAYPAARSLLRDHEIFLKGLAITPSLSQPDFS